MDLLQAIKSYRFPHFYIQDTDDNLVAILGVQYYTNRRVIIVQEDMYQRLDLATRMKGYNIARLNRFGIDLPKLPIPHHQPVVRSDIMFWGPNIREVQRLSLDYAERDYDLTYSLQPFEFTQRISYE